MLGKSTAFLNSTNRYELAVLLGVKHKSLLFFAYGSGKYRRFEIPKKGGGRREIFAPIEGLKVAQTRLAEILEEIYPNPACAYGFIKGKGIAQNAAPHVGKRVVLNFDLKDFFPSITAPRLIKLFRSKPFNFNSEIASTLAGLVCHKDSLPQGAPTSPIISNMICFRLDRALRELARRERLTYTRYADDITFSSFRRKLPASVYKRVDETKFDLGDELRQIVVANYFEVNDKKTRLSYGTKSKYVTGVRVNTIANANKTYVRQIRAMIHAWEKFGKSAAQSDFRDRYGGGSKDFVRVLRGKLAHLKNIKGDADLQYRRLYNKFVTLEGRGVAQLPEGEIEELQEKVFVINGSGGQGTAFVLNERLLITCQHIVGDANEVEYFGFNDFPAATRKKVPVDHTKVSAEFDIAILEPKGVDKAPNKSFKACSTSEPVQLEKDYRILGYPLYEPGRTPRIQPARVIGLERDRKRDVQLAYVNAVLLKGNSGGVVLNGRNEVVGLVARGAPDATYAHDWGGFAFIPMSEIRRYASSIGLTI